MGKLLSKPALAIYVGLVILIAYALGFGEQACGIAEGLGFTSDLCVAEPVAE